MKNIIILELATMAALFSGIWHKNNQNLITQLYQLKKLAHNVFDIEISVTKMLAEDEYRLLVINELTQLSHPDINDIISWLTRIDEPEESTKAKNINFNAGYAFALSFIFIMVTASFFWFSYNDQPTIEIVKTSSEKSVTSTNTITASPKSGKDNAIAKLSPKAVVETLAPEREVAFRLHGSNTIGEKLAPMLIEGFLQQQGVKDFSWKNIAPLERVLHYQQDNKHYAIELHSHGSSTAFSSLKNKKADIGMASRRIKAKEVKMLSATEGNLNKLGNEHIIGLDGLAVIVNQNNTVKQLTNQTLAKIFSGEINNWSQVGGNSAPIKLYARDEHSGTWDTFKNLVLKKNNQKLSTNALRLESSSKLSTLVSQNENAIGFIGLNYVLHNKAIAISESKEASAIFPTRFTVGTEDYALSRRLYFYTPTSASMLIKNFAQYALSNAGQEIVADAGLISQNIKLENIYPLDSAPDKYKEYAKIAKRLSLNFRFDYATKDLDNKGKRDLQRLVSFMEEYPSKRLVLMGFSDSIGAVTKNALLSLKRAKSVEQALSSRGIPVLAVEGMGEALPIANNNLEAGRKRNRRVEVWLF